MVTERFDLEDYGSIRDKHRYYNHVGWENAKKDVDPVIRLRYYNKVGYDKDALKDDFHAIRFSAYQSLGWSKKALEDSCTYIKNFAYNKFHIYK